MRKKKQAIATITDSKKESDSKNITTLSNSNRYFENLNSIFALKNMCKNVCKIELTST